MNRARNDHVSAFTNLSCVFMSNFMGSRSSWVATATTGRSHYCNLKYITCQSVFDDTQCGQAINK